LILDTNGISAMAEGDPAIKPVLLQASELAIPVVALGEFRYGILQSRERARYERWLAEYLRQFRLLEIDERTTLSYSNIRLELKKADTPIPSNDVWIAALSRQHSLPVVTRDRHFDFVSGITRLSW
jgi:tRNA(fMet)-specific endonuclease VapC